MPYWFNVDTGQVETDDNRSQDANVMGPYDSHDAAANALQHAREPTPSAGTARTRSGAAGRPGTRSPRKTEAQAPSRRCTDTA